MKILARTLATIMCMNEIGESCKICQNFKTEIFEEKPVIFILEVCWHLLAERLKCLAMVQFFFNNILFLNHSAFYIVESSF